MLVGIASKSNVQFASHVLLLCGDSLRTREQRQGGGIDLISKLLTMLQNQIIESLRGLVVFERRRFKVCTSRDIEGMRELIFREVDPASQMDRFWVSRKSPGLAVANILGVLLRGFSNQGGVFPLDCGELAGIASRFAPGLSLPVDRREPQFRVLGDHFAGLGCPVGERMICLVAELSRRMVSCEASLPFVELLQRGLGDFNCGLRIILIGHRVGGGSDYCCDASAGRHRQETGCGECSACSRERCCSCGQVLKLVDVLCGHQGHRSHRANDLEQDRLEAFAKSVLQFVGIAAQRLHLPAGRGQAGFIGPVYPDTSFQCGLQASFGFLLLGERAGRLVGIRREILICLLERNHQADGVKLPYLPGGDALDDLLQRLRRADAADLRRVLCYPRELRFFRKVNTRLDEPGCGLQRRLRGDAEVFDLLGLLTNSSDAQAVDAGKAVGDRDELIGARGVFGGFDNVVFNRAGDTNDSAGQ